MVSRRNFLRIAGGSAALVASGCGGPAGSLLDDDLPSPPPGDPNGLKDRIEHIIFTMQENRSFDHYFGRMPQYRAARGIPGQVDGLPEGASNPSFDKTFSIDSYKLLTECHENLSPSWNESKRMWNRDQPASPTAKLDGFVFAAANFTRNSGQGTDTEGKRAMGYYDESDIPFYYALASQFATSDRHFSSAPAATLCNRMYLMAASSFGRVYPKFPEEQQVNADTIFDLCEKKGVSWKIYVNGGFTYYSWFTGSTRPERKAKIVNAEQFFEDAESGKLPQVAMIESGTNTRKDEHPMNNIQEGAAYMERFYRALMSSPAWSRSIMVQTYDEAGGFFDHVVPPSAPKPDDIEPILRDGDVPGSFDRYGYRVPLMVVSPWVRKHYVSHAVTDQTSILKLIERRFDLASLSRRDAQAHDLLDMFDFERMSWEKPPELPSQSTSGVCDWSAV